MSLLDGIANVAKGALGIATAPARTGLKILGTGLKTVGQQATDLSKGDVKGFVQHGVDGLKGQVGNVVGAPKDLVHNAGQMVGGYGDFLGSGARLIGQPILGAGQAALNQAGTGLMGAGQVLTGDFSGAGQTYQQGSQRSLDILGQTASKEWNNFAG